MNKTAAVHSVLWPQHRMNVYTNFAVDLADKAARETRAVMNAMQLILWKGRCQLEFDPPARQWPR